MFSDKVIRFFSELDFNGKLPVNVAVMNPFREDKNIMPLITEFYHKYYDDDNERTLILGINPGRFGAGVTGIPFTDTKRLKEIVGLNIEGIDTFETSSVFIYDMIKAYGGAEKFYKRFFISAVSPLGFTIEGRNKKPVNYNYYDSKELTNAVYSFIKSSLEMQLSFGVNREKCFCLGSGKNYGFLLDFNSKHKYFKEIVPLEHPRFIMQYRSSRKNEFVNMYVEKLNS